MFKILVNEKEVSYDYKSDKYFMYFTVYSMFTRNAKSILSYVHGMLL